jgi:tristetraprolin/butyrate response factor 1
MMMSSHENPAVARVQQQHSVFRGTHQHSSSDPLHLREAAALLSSALPPFTQPGLYPPALGPPIYPNQFYPPPDAYGTPGVAAQVMAAARLQSQFHPSYGVGLPGQSISPGLGDGSQTSAQGVDPGGNGPSANNRKLGLYKTELCRSWEEKGTCRYGPKCQFAHGEEEIRKVSRHPKVVPVNSCF